MQCRHCGRKFLSPSDLNEHLWAKHKECKLPTADDRPSEVVVREMRSEWPEH